MAQLNSRGTVTRSRWDFYEHSDGFAFVTGSVPSGSIGAYFANNSTGAAAIDIYSLIFSASVSTIVEVSFLLPPFIMVPVTPAESFIHPLAPINATPPGVVGMFSNSTGVYWTIVRYSAASSGATLAPIMGTYFLTLPPGWAIMVETASQPNPIELSMTVWYQEVTDNVPPAR